MNRVSALGYVIAETTRLARWHEFAVGVHGMLPVLETAERLLLRLDERAWRIDVRAGATDGPVVLGWEVDGPQALDVLAGRLAAAGYAVAEGTPELVAERRVSRLVSFTDPDGLTLELFYGQSRATDPFASPTGVRFATGDMGLGHIMQFVSDSNRYRALYQGILGFELTDYVDIGPDPGTFLHCNPRHHSMAFASVPGLEPRVGHLMVQVDQLDGVGRAYDRLLDSDFVIGSTFGKHSNDQMISYYVKTPGESWELEYGYGGIRVGADWLPARWDHAHLWGHRRQGGSRLPQGLVLPTSAAAP